MSQCLFCGIASGAIPSEIVAEDDHVLAFRDLNPQAPCHLLVIPRQHITSLAALREDQLSLTTNLVAMVQHLAEHEGLARGWRMVTNVGPDGGQTVEHLHLHLLGGRRMAWPPG
ncbi:MAG: histidine triad nucleotide-binding protein [Candidatus Dormibacteria bacterium]